MTDERTRWGIKWISDNRLEGHKEHFTGTPEGWEVFRTRSEARNFRDARYGYIKDRPDLKAEPHGWKLPKVVKVIMTIREADAEDTSCP